MTLIIADDEKYFLLHIGFEKTGSSFLQSQFFPLLTVATETMTPSGWS
jgi:hypothetical protein